MCTCHHRTPDYLVMILHPPPPLTVHQTPIPQMMTLQKPPQPLLTQIQELIPINPTNRTRMLPTLKRLLLQMISQHSQNRDPRSGECSSKPPLSLPTTPDLLYGYLAMVLHHSHLPAGSQAVEGPRAGPGREEMPHPRKQVLLISLI